jgi:UMF1 family MFS transporter
VYDMGNTLFFTGVVGIFFPLWATQEMSGNDATVGYTLSLAMSVVLVLGPLLGTLSDQSGRRMPFLLVSTIACIGATLMIGGSNLVLGMVLFAVAVIAVHTAAIFYNAMLGNVSTEGTRGTIAGFGVGVGYLGGIIALAIGLLFVETRGTVFGFRAIGLLVLLVSLPLFLLLKERHGAVGAVSPAKMAANTVRQLRLTLGAVRKFPGLVRFLTARFWYAWSFQTAAFFAILYGTETVGFTARQVEFVFLLGMLVAVPASFMWGVIVDRVGPKPTLSAVLFVWALLLLVAAAIPWLELPPYLWWPVSAVAGVLVPGTWVADRPLMLRLTAPEYLGEFFGLHGMVGRLSAIVGPFVWSYISVTQGLGQGAAVLSLSACGLIGFLIMRGVDDSL